METVDKIDLLLRGFSAKQVEEIEAWQKKHKRLDRFLKELK